MTAAPTRTAASTGSDGVGRSTEGLLARQARRERAARIPARSLPVVPVRTRGMTVDGADGRRYLDCLAGAGPLVLGHSHPVVLEAIRAVPDTEPPPHGPARATPIEERFVETLFDTLPPEFARDARILFCGPADTDAVDAAIALARGTTGREGVLVSAGLCRGALPYPDTDHLAARAPDLAAVVLEAVRGDGAVVPAPDTWLREIRHVTARHDIPLIVDETQTGLGRTGAFWAFEHSGIVPDAVIVPGGSLPLTAVVHRGPPGTAAAHAAAFRGNQLAMAAGTATITHIRENHLDTHAARIGERLAQGLRQIQADTPTITAVRARGLMLGLELTTPTLTTTVRAEALTRGLITGQGGPHNTVLRLLPPLTMTEAQAEAVLTRLSDAVTAAVRRPAKPDAQ